MQEQSAFRNLIHNLTKKQVIAIVLGLVFLVIVAIVLSNIASSPTGSSNDNDTNEDSSANEVYVDENGYTITTEVNIDENGEEYTVTTREDPYGNVTTTDPNLISTYFPYQVMREHVDWNPTLRYFLYINEESKTIYVNMEDCDIENDKKLIAEYIDSIPIDLSAYNIEYELSTVDTDCGP